MTYLKTLGLFAVTAVAMMGFAGSASANFTSPTGTEYTGEFDMSAEASLLFKAGLEITCNKSTVKGNITTNDTEHASGPITELAFSECNGTTATITLGSLTIKGDELIMIGSAWTTQRFGINCIYGGGASPGTKLGTLTNKTFNGKDAVTLDVEANLPKQAGGAFCANILVWSGSYVFTTPIDNYLDFT